MYYKQVFVLQDEPLPVANAHALHGVPPVAVATQVSSTAPQPNPLAASDNQVKDDALNHAESKIDEDKLQVIVS